MLITVTDYAGLRTAIAVDHNSIASVVDMGGYRMLWMKDGTQFTVTQSQSALSASIAAANKNPIITLSDILKNASIRLRVDTILEYHAALVNIAGIDTVCTHVVTDTGSYNVVESVAAIDGYFNNVS